MKGRIPFVLILVVLVLLMTAPVSRARSTYGPPPGSMAPSRGHASPAFASTVYSSAGSDPAAIQSTVNDFRTALGTLNPNAPGSVGSGRREINWDGVPDTFAAPNNLPGDFFNVNSPRGAVFTTSGSGFQVSADRDTPPDADPDQVRFDTIRVGYSSNFATFSPERLFTALGSNVMDVGFFVPGSTTPALVRGFGVVFTDVERGNSTAVEFFHGSTSLGTHYVPPSSNAGLSFLGVDFGANVVTRVRLTSGQGALGPPDLPDGGTLDLVVMDDFIYGEPVQLPQPPPQPQPGAGDPPSVATDPAFAKVWAVTDLAVQRGQTSRSWLWGPGTYKTTREPYAQSPGGQRLVEYYDKSRMEINNPNGDRNNLFFVTNGLLPIELMTGRLKTGDAASQYEQRQPADVPVAGDPAAGNPNAPTYQSFSGIATVDVDVAPRRASAAVGSVVIATLNRAGQVNQDQALSRYNVRIAQYDEKLGHNVPDVFQRYLNGLTINALFAMGYPISEPYWAKVRVGGVEKDVLVQAFERRVLTYTPTNPEGFKVEMGNVGQHYYQWRYGTTPWQQ